MADQNVLVLPLSDAPVISSESVPTAYPMAAPFTIDFKSSYSIPIQNIPNTIHPMHTFERTNEPPVHWSRIGSPLKYEYVVWHGVSYGLACSALAVPMPNIRTDKHKSKHHTGISFYRKSIPGFYTSLSVENILKHINRLSLQQSMQIFFQMSFLRSINFPFKRQKYEPDSEFKGLG